ncbi:lytic transglycosylase domain-containing protein [Aureimonas altamirensis]|uniref:lytic transglycosylase domain-containing protein n=1 Tax=Aureimonas altamirensis TaxID=370622 RepID=UPI001E4C5CC5|nr:lytic transglycosylase domain-containing protein [Aureimonas altamirensis]UHD44125.1 lytic transglycosylase domain-containing protein [Aureimonas altamirensis]
MRSRVSIACKSLIPLFAEKPSHPFVPLVDRTAGARSEGQGRPSAGASRPPLTAASTLAGWRRSREGSHAFIAVLLLSGFASMLASPAATMAQSAPVAQPMASHPYIAHVAEASQRFGIPTAWIRAVLRAESASDVRAISSAGAMGLMQVMPDTWAALRVRYRLGRDPYDPRDNILAGTAYLREMYDRYGNVGAMLAAYNAGPGRYDEHLVTGRALPAETRAYVATIAQQIAGGVITGPVMVATADPNAWRQAPLFVARSIDGRAADSGRPGDGSTVDPVRDVTTIAPQSEGLFVASASGGEPR